MRVLFFSGSAFSCAQLNNRGDERLTNLKRLKADSSLVHLLLRLEWLFAARNVCMQASILPVYRCFKTKRASIFIKK